MKNYPITIFDDSITEIIEMKQIDMQLVYLYRRCLSNIKNKNILLKGILFEWQDRRNELTFIQVKDLIEKFKFLEDTNLSEEYEDLRYYVSYNY